MAGKSQQPKGQDGVLSSLNAAIGALERAKATGVTPAEATFTSASTLLTEIKVGSFQFILVDCRLMYVGFNDQQSGLRRAGANLLGRL